MIISPVETRIFRGACSFSGSFTTGETACAGWDEEAERGAPREAPGWAICSKGRTWKRNDKGDNRS